MRTLLCIIMLTVLVLRAPAQSITVDIRFEPVFQGKPLVLDSSYFLPAINDSVRIETLRFYLSDVGLTRGEAVTNEEPAYYLIDASEPSTQTINLTFNQPIHADALRFNIGIDSLTNVSGAMGGPLDPMNGMYWAWQSGYINFKLEGSSPVCNTRNQVFQYHIGGYSHPFNALQQVVLPIDNPQAVTVYIHLDRLLSGAGLATDAEIMSPSGEAVQFAQMIKQCFTLSPQP